MATNTDKYIFLLSALPPHWTLPSLLHPALAQGPDKLVSQSLGTLHSSWNPTVGLISFAPTKQYWIRKLQTKTETPVYLLLSLPTKAPLSDFQGAPVFKYRPILKYLPPAILSFLPQNTDHSSCIHWSLALLQPSLILLTSGLFCCAWSWYCPKYSWHGICTLSLLSVETIFTWEGWLLSQTDCKCFEIENYKIPLHIHPLCLAHTVSTHILVGLIETLEAESV
jgi:hypothetical protein